MSRSIVAGHAGSCRCQPLLAGGRSQGGKLLRHIKASTLAGLVILATTSLLAATKASAASFADDPVIALRDYAQSIASPSNGPQGKTSDAVIERLRAFAQRLGTDKPPLIKGASISVAANSFFEAIQENLQNKNRTVPAEKPKATPPATKHSEPVVNAHSVGSKVCLGCHTGQATIFEHTLMGRLMKQGKLQCETCHGPGSEHVRLGGGRGVGGIISFRKDDTSRTAEENNGICLGCHERGDRTNWHGSIHETRGLACTNCHTIMKAVSRKNQLKTAFEPDTCFQCHKDRRAQMFRSSHMPMREGKIVCSNCHNPHGSFTEALLKKDSINDVCYTCHAEKRGPFLFEHEPVRENCLNCHDPHGTINEFSLKLSRPRLCFECHQFGHGQFTGPNSVFTMGRQCQNCHTAVHGSNSPAGGAFQR
jgi:DmsE family decaheme c-type cytochrome